MSTFDHRRTPQKINDTPCKNANIRKRHISTHHRPHLPHFTTHYRNCVCTARNAVFLDSLSRANIVAKRFVFAPQQWRFSQLDDVMTRPRREEKLPTPALALAQSRPSSGLAGWLASPSRPLPARRHNGGRGRHWPARCRQSSPSSGLAGWLASPSRPLPGATTAGGGGTGPRDAASSARCAALLCGTRPQAARAGSPALLQARRRARREGRPRVDANPCCARLCAPCQVGTEPGAG